MNEYQPQQYYGYYPVQYQPMTPALPVWALNAVIAMMLIAWGISLMRKAIKGEEVEYPL